MNETGGQKSPEQYVEDLFEKSDVQAFLQRHDEQIRREDAETLRHYLEKGEFVVARYGHRGLEVICHSLDHSEVESALDMAQRDYEADQRRDEDLQIGLEEPQLFTPADIIDVPVNVRPVRRPAKKKE